MSERESTSPSFSPPVSSPRVAGPGRGLAWLLIASAAVVFWPLTRWMVTETVQRAQIRQGFILLAAAAVLVAVIRRRELRLVYELSNAALGLLGAAFVLASLAVTTGWSWLALPAFAFGLAGCLRLLFGAGSYRFLKPLVTGFALFAVIIGLFPALDWPLRQMAGRGAAAVLHTVGFAPRLGIWTGALGNEEPKLLLTLGQQVFHVAAECNGFGLITSAALLAVLAGGIVGRRAVQVAGLGMAAVVVGFVFNLLRIVAICVLAPYFPGNYHAMHEVLGTLALWAGLGLVGWWAAFAGAPALTRAPTPTPTPAPAAGPARGGELGR